MDVRQYVEDYTSGNARLGQLLAALLYSIYSTLVDAGIGLGSALRWAYYAGSSLRGGPPYPARTGKIPAGTPTPMAKLDLRPGERVRVKKYPEILATLNDKWHNRGMYFDPEEVVFCGGGYEVLRRVDHIIDERTGKMLHLKSDAIILKDVVCQARYARCRKLCPEPSIRIGGKSGSNGFPIERLRLSSELPNSGTRSSEEYRKAPVSAWLDCADRVRCVQSAALVPRRSNATAPAI